MHPLHSSLKNLSSGLWLLQCKGLYNKMADEGVVGGHGNVIALHVEGVIAECKMQKLLTFFLHDAHAGDDSALDLLDPAFK